MEHSRQVLHYRLSLDQTRNLKHVAHVDCKTRLALHSPVGPVHRPFLHLAVGRARVVDQAGQVPAAVRIDEHARVQMEAVMVRVARVDFSHAAMELIHADHLADVLGQEVALTHRLLGHHTEALVGPEVHRFEAIGPVLAADLLVRAPLFHWAHPRRTLREDEAVEAVVTAGHSVGRPASASGRLVRTSGLDVGVDI